MIKNLGKADRLVRIAVALAIGLLYVENVISGLFGIALIAVALIFVVTSFFSFCPLYKILGLNSKSAKK